MKKNKEQCHVPALRFPEFWGSGEWIDDTLKNIATFYKGKRISKTDISENGKLPCIRYGELYTHYQEVVEEVISFTNISSDELVLSRANDVIIPSSGETREDIATATCVLLDGVALGGDLNIIRTTTNGIFLSYYLNNAKKRQIAQMAQGVSVIHLYASQLQNLELSLPTITEQQKIANCLSSLDEWITAESKQLTVLKTHKTGLMQQLFPNEGETTPKLRFPEFQNDGEWEKSTIGDISFISSGGTPNRQNQSYWGGDIPWITTTLIDFNYIDKAAEYITQKGLENSSAKKFKENTILMAMYGQGKTRGKVAILSITAATNQACAAIQVKSNYNVNFVFQNLMSRYEEIRKISNEGGQKNLSATIIKTIPFKYPPKEEQQKIADCLSSLDTLITAQTEKIEQLKHHKKGLMQQLFPALDGVGA